MNLTSPFRLVATLMMYLHIPQVISHLHNHFVDRQNIGWWFRATKAGSIPAPTDNPVCNHRYCRVLSCFTAGCLEQHHKGNVMRENYNLPIRAFYRQSFRNPAPVIVVKR